MFYGIFSANGEEKNVSRMETAPFLRGDAYLITNERRSAASSCPAKRSLLLCVSQRLALALPQWAETQGILKLAGRALTNVLLSAEP